MGALRLHKTIAGGILSLDLQPDKVGIGVGACAAATWGRVVRK